MTPPPRSRGQQAPAWTRDQLIACLDGPLTGTW